METVDNIPGYTKVKVERGRFQLIIPSMGMHPWTDYCNELAQWCNDRFGPGMQISNSNNKYLTKSELWYFHQRYGFVNFFFKNEVDATAFGLRWG